MAASSTELGRLIRIYRATHDLTQEELAAKLGVTGATISRWESGQSRPDARSVIALACVLEMTDDLEALMAAAGYSYQAATGATA